MISNPNSNLKYINCVYYYKALPINKDPLFYNLLSLFFKLKNYIIDLSIEQIIY